MDNIILIGIDGGATKVSGWIIEYSKESKLFQISDVNVQKKYSEYSEYNPAYVPVEITTQLSEMNTGIIRTEGEIKQGNVYMNAVSDVIIELLNEYSDKRALVGIGMPGLKTNDKRGLVAVANGPRMPEYSEFIESRLKDRNLTLLSPIAHLGSDADYCGLGEEYSEDGLFKDVKNAYYLGGGTGVADAFKLNGNLVPFDNAKEWIAKAWEMKSDKNLSLERYASASGIQSIYSKYSKQPVEELNERQIYPPQILEMALQNNKDALSTINDISFYIAKLLFERITTIYSGWSGLFSFVNPSKKIEKSEHDYKGVLLERIIIGQRLGDLLHDSKNTPLLWNQIVSNLTDFFNNVQDKKLVSHYLSNGRFKSELIAISRLREAPAIGAGVDAFLNYQNL